MKKQDGLLKYQCKRCGNEFIIGKVIAERTHGEIYCPFCQHEEIEAVVLLPADDERNKELGCMGIYYNE